jgi:phage minor structural protein
LAIFAFDRDENIIGVLEQGNKNACQYWNAKIKRVLNGETTLTLTVDYNHPTAKNIVEFGYLAVQNKYKQWELFLITELDQDHTSTLTMDITAEASQVELDGVIIPSLTFDRKNVTDVLPSILQGTRWQIGTTVQNTTDVHDLTISNKSVLACLQDLRDTWGVELNFYVQISGNKIIGRYVEAYVTRGAWKGKRFEWSKDLTEVKRVINAQNIKTALIGIGANQSVTNADGTQTTTALDFTTVQWAIANGDPLDKPAGQNWLGDPNALAIYGKPLAGGTTKKHMFGIYSDNEATSPEDLLQHTYNQLKILSAPVITYSMKTVDLYEILHIEDESVDLGDVVAVIDRDLGIEVQARVIEQDENLDYPEQDDTILGNFLPFYTGDNLKQSGSFEQLKAQVNATGKLDPQWVATEFGFAYNELTAGSGTVIINQGDGILIVDDPTNPQKAIKLVGGMLALASSRDLTTGEFNWRTFDTGDGILSDLVETGFLRFDRSQGGVLTLGGAVTGYQDLTTDEIINFVGKANGDGDNTRQFFYNMQANTELAPTAMTAEVNAGYASIANPNDGKQLALTITNTQHYKIRYIRDWLNGNTVNLNNYWNEVECWAGQTDRCMGIMPTISSGTLTNGANITNGNHADYAYEASGNGVAKYVQIDLGAVHTDIDTIKIFHYYADGRTFHGTKTEISTDGVNWTTIFASTPATEYVETSVGKTYTPTVGTAVGDYLQYVFKLVVDKPNLRGDVSFQANGITGETWTVKPWNFTTGAWDMSIGATKDSASTDPVIISFTDFTDYVDASGTVYFSMLSPALTADSSVTMTIDYVEMDYTLYTETVPIYQSGELDIIDDTGHKVASLSGENRGFDQLWIGEISGNNVVTWNNLGDLTYYVDPINGNDAHGGLSSTDAFKTIQRAISKIPMLNPYTITINIVGTGITFVETVAMNGIIGSGKITLVLGQSNIMKGQIGISKCLIDILIRTLAEGSTTSTANVSATRAQIVAQTNNTGSAVVAVWQTPYCSMEDIVINGNNVATYGTNCDGSYVQQHLCECYNCLDSALLNQFGGRAEVEDCAGLNPNGILTAHASHTGGFGRGYYANSGNHVRNWYGAVCTVVWTYDQGAQKPLYAPVQTTQWTANDIKSLFPPTHWDTYGSWIYLMHGLRNSTEKPWYGVAFFNNRDFSALKNQDGTNRTIQKVRILVQRYNGYGANVGIKPKIWWNAQTSGSGNPGPNISSLNDGTWSNQTFLWGEQKWIDLPVSFGQAFQAGTAKSIVFYNGADTANYSRFNANMTLEITHA